MPKNKVEMRSVNKEIFLKVLKLKRSSIRKLGKDDRIQITERTIRRCLKDGRMRDSNIRDIAQLLDVDTRVLTGNIYSVCDYFTFDPIEHLELYPYSREEEDKYRIESSKIIISRILATFNRSYVQYEALSVDEQYQFEEEIYNSLFSIVAKYFPRNLFGEENAEEDTSFLDDLTYEREEKKRLQYADTILREAYIANPPQGYSSEQIRKMSREQIYALDEAEFFEELFSKPSSLEKEYKKKFNQTE